MALRDKIKDILGHIFRKKLPEAELGIETSEVSENTFTESLKDKLEGTSFEEKFDRLLDSYQRIESNISSEYPSTIETPKIILGTILEKKGASRELIGNIVNNSSIRLAESNLWPSIYTKKLSTTDGPQIIIPILRDLELIGYNNSEGLMTWKNTLMNMVDVSPDGNKMTITSREREIYHGEECDVDYTNSYETSQGEETFSISKYFDPVTTAEYGIEYKCKVKRIQGVDYELEEEKRGYLDDKDNYYYKATRKPGTKTIHVVADGQKKADGFTVEYDYESGSTIDSYDNSIAKIIIDNDETTHSESGRKMLEKLLGEKLKNTEESEFVEEYDLNEGHKKKAEREL